MKKHRMARVSEMIREVASETILFKMSDPRVKRVTVMSVEVSPDLQHARVKVSVMGTPAQQATTLKGLQHAAGARDAPEVVQMLVVEPHPSPPH